MNPTLLYNNYHLQRRKMFQTSPRNNLYSTIDFTWKDSVSGEVSPKEKLQLKKEYERKVIGERSNQLIAKRLKKQVMLDSEAWVLQSYNGKRSSSLQVNNKTDKNRNHISNLPSMDTLKDTLNQQVQNYYSTNKFSHNRRYSNHPFPANPSETLIPSSLKPNNYTRHFDPQLQSLASRQSMANTELSELIPKGNNYLGKFLNRKLEKYLIGDGANSRVENLDDFEGLKVE